MNLTNDQISKGIQYIKEKLEESGETFSFESATKYFIDLVINNNIISENDMDVYLAQRATVHLQEELTRLQTRVAIINSELGN